MNGLPLCLLTPDTDTLLMTPRAALYCELRLTDGLLYHKPGALPRTYVCSPVLVIVCTVLEEY